MSHNSIQNLSKILLPENEIKFVFQAPAMELREFLIEKKVFNCASLEFYARGLLFYLEGKENDLRVHLENSPDVPDFDLARSILTVRLSILTGDELPLGLIANLKVLVRQDRLIDLRPSECAWAAEADFSLAIFEETKKNYFEAEELFARAHEGFVRVGFEIKAVKALHNIFSARSKRVPTLRQIPEYQNCARWAERAGDLSTQAMAYTNLSREFQILKAYRVSLKYANLAVQLLERDFYATYNYYFSLCHRAHLHWELGNQVLAKCDYEEARGTSHVEIKTALAVLKNWMGEEESEEKSIPSDVDTMPTWNERMINGIYLVDTPLKELPELEYRLLECLSQGPQLSIDLIKHIWGTSIDYIHLENRFKQLLVRFRKRCPGLVAYAEGKYFLRELDQRKAEPVRLSVKKKRDSRLYG